MTVTRFPVLAATLATAVTLLSLPCRSEERAATKANPQESAAASPESTDPSPVSIETARDRAVLMHKLYLATLDTMHDHYFHANRSVLPARAMEDVFSSIAEETKIESRWISVNIPPMSVHHEPRDAFEKKAAAEISAGKPFYEAVENGRYRRVGAVPMAGGCVSCHMGTTLSMPTTPRFSGLVINIPVQTK